MSKPDDKAAPLSERDVVRFLAHDVSKRLVGRSLRPFAEEIGTNIDTLSKARRGLGDRKPAFEAVWVKHFYDGSWDRFYSEARAWVREHPKDDIVEAIVETAARLQRLSDADDDDSYEETRTQLAAMIERAARRPLKAPKEMAPIKKPSPTKSRPARERRD